MLILRMVGQPGAFCAAASLAASATKATASGAALIQMQCDMAFPSSFAFSRWRGAVPFVGWVERSETHQLPYRGEAADGFRCALAVLQACGHSITSSARPSSE